MNTNQFYLLIIIIILIIIISLFIQCNKKVLKNLEENATKDIIETYYHLDSAAPTEPGQKGYEIISISEGRYGGRSEKVVLDNIDGHNVGDYISIEDKNSYGSNLFNSNINGIEKNAINCSINTVFGQTCLNLDSGIGSHSIIKKLGNVVDLTNGMYGGTPCPINFYQHNDGNTYKVLKEDSATQCNPSDAHHNLLNIIVNADNTITITEPNYHGFFYSEEVFNILDITDITAINNTINYGILFKLIHNHKKDNQDNIKDKMKSKYGDYLKYSKNDKYYNISIANGFKFVFTNCEQTGRFGPSQLQCDNTYGSGVVETEGGIQNFIVPFSGIYKITAIGANGGNSLTGWGRGYLYEGRFNLGYNDNLKILIGQKGEDKKTGGGGGATYVLKNEVELIISGGGGGIHKNYMITNYTVTVPAAGELVATINNETNAEGYMYYNKVVLDDLVYPGRENPFYKFGLTDKKYGDTPTITKTASWTSSSTYYTTIIAEKMGNGGKVESPNSPEGGFGGGGGGGGDNKTIFSSDSVSDSVGGGGGGYFGGASGRSPNTAASIIGDMEFVKFFPNIPVATINNIRNSINIAENNDIPINYWNGIGGSSYINEEEAINDTIIERVITDIDMSNYNTNGHGKVIIEYLG